MQRKLYWMLTIYTFNCLSCTNKITTIFVWFFNFWVAIIGQYLLKYTLFIIQLASSYKLFTSFLLAPLKTGIVVSLYQNNSKIVVELPSSRSTYIFSVWFFIADLFLYCFFEMALWFFLNLVASDGLNFTSNTIQSL